MEEKKKHLAQLFLRRKHQAPDDMWAVVSNDTLV